MYDVVETHIYAYLYENVKRVLLLNDGYTPMKLSLELKNVVNEVENQTLL